ncbi:protein kinase [Modestobacter sp. NPDC049651]|uniref:serine/threonine-protein kinase n=1 Tax=unclassified Modestobacter TaxID=2643866 RepID=UPI0033F52C69
MRVLDGRYELLRPLASGGMGRVWEGRDALLGRPVAVKVLHEGLSADSTFRDRFRAEARLAGMVNHPNVAAVYDVGEEPADGLAGPVAFLVMELVPAESLARVLDRRGRLPAGETLDLVGQVAAALAAAHAVGVVHRDVKPGNVLVRPDGVVKITDFGIARSAGSVPLTRTGEVVGTAYYLSPEQAAGAPATAASDVYALGAVAYECLTGHRPFDGESAVQVLLRHRDEQPPPLPDDVPAGVRALVELLMAKDPARRLADGPAVVEAVARVTRAPDDPAVLLPVVPLPAGRPAVAADTQPVPRARPGRPRRSVLLGAGAGGGAVALATALFLLTGASSGPDGGGGTGPDAAGATQAPATVTEVVVQTAPAPAPALQTGESAAGTAAVQAPVTSAAPVAAVVATDPPEQQEPQPEPASAPVAVPAPGGGDGRQDDGSQDESAPDTGAPMKGAQGRGPQGDGPPGQARGGGKAHGKG